MRKIVGVKKPINRLSVDKVLINILLNTANYFFATLHVLRQNHLRSISVHKIIVRSIVCLDWR